MAKRLFDIVLALVLSVIFAPILIILIVAIKLDDFGPVFYVSERMRAPGRPFKLWKLRTMRADPNDSGASGAYKSARITRVGRLLRKTRGDEIPQLWNVLKGDMSFVGPRPPLRLYVEKFPALYGEVLKCRPGITGLASLLYHRHEDWLLSRCTTAEENEAVYTRSCVPKKAQLDLIYRDNQTLCFDLWIIWRTAAGVFSRK
ncbi:sugar transferase [Shimia thalassica]|uniref:sugar transferase n=1 Tax=Shimia thalassica TaxID=1715693 RepID=UPI0026E1895B|nr:sugar transferase [Shimia thalassica]MDO6799754.1 sugar transferase [Shimia thalassica]MDP2494368.1 sugar transferase [Shimia thalassica]